jgi:hypothetical protein
MFPLPRCRRERASWHSSKAEASSCSEQAEGPRLFHGLCAAFAIEAGIGAIISVLIFLLKLA